MQSKAPPPLIAIACGGTGGHLFPGLAVAQVLYQRGCDLVLLVSPKEVDQQAVRSIREMRVVTLPAVGLQRGRFSAFARGFWMSLTASRALFRERKPQAALAMGGFTSAPPILAARSCGARTFLHEGNAIPGRANRWLAHAVDHAFVFFPEAAGRLWHQHVATTGMPVRSEFTPADSAACRIALGLDPSRPVLLVTGGSQGASAVNDLILRLLPALNLLEPELQYLHLTGPNDPERIRDGYAAQKCKAVVRPFLTEMDLALGAATVAISRAGASSLAEQAAMRLPSILIPYPSAADNHQFYNAQAFVATDAARMVEQSMASPETLLWEVRRLLKHRINRQTMIEALAKWHAENAASLVADRILETLPPASRAVLSGSLLEESAPRSPVLHPARVELRT